MDSGYSECGEKRELTDRQKERNKTSKQERKKERKTRKKERKQERKKENKKAIIFCEKCYSLKVAGKSANISIV